ncbi:MAG: DUF2236 domain-containing protein [Actinobacteria bacterium]|nr:DUF2236 domain-containing protein [Actinomycetota bacterium]
MGQPVMWVAGFRAFYLQALHPRVMRGTWQNTMFAQPRGAWGRFQRTTEFVLIRTYGSLAEVERAGRRVRHLHASLHGTNPDGTGFRLDEPELLLWVHCAEVGSYADVARRSGVPVTAAELDAFVAEQRRSAAVVGLDPAAAPASVAELDSYFERLRPVLHVTPETRSAVLRGLNPSLPAPYLPLKLAVPPLTTLGFASLPRWARRRYGFPGSPLTDVAATAGLRACQEVGRRIPPQLLTLPARAAHRRSLARQSEPPGAGRTA